ncbi:MAG: bifunctional tRNA (5-methylaminomethyl-2-thiouridine)(34)-methyltransferase MnmD/FAD-dependent 5-carboxymethylaminomethyl-2-thiouridine(34) oxidoreductase MnmC [Neptuniibacter caesariensis]|uniref:tRNA 5-methylaminomethyl-2-thiouridine biosynthesis bifunctional protein MnmC n=1 Tax=Neptuniibacter caesariensis TaxID=207954 RepID=A0A2G6JM77_NEPCE|nr:MAG: bifunctional tRNA (5-methylaminomethyl-2-thiouridine)(34)-methyltransferase MnmD/FAD-dependent 5-carboxymethylaminomethyl-2-thiouridine(34) oxidoreductase MnmC [Neptuniibacter caesariensis]
MTHVNSDNLIWQDQTPVSQQFGDIYFSLEDGLAESEYVFLHSNNILARATTGREHSVFTIAETGFGTGLNFLCTWLAWRKNRITETPLHFISVEKFPLTREEIAQALAHWPELAELSAQLLEQYPAIRRGFQNFHFDNGNIRLTLIFSDAVNGYSQLYAKVDAWYLDGFAPAKNPDMWCPALFREVARLSHPATTFATFTAAGLVRRGLQEAGFDVRKQKGFGRKREMLVGTFIRNEPSHSSHPPWFELPVSTRPLSAIVIGGGLSGCSTARALADRGIKVTLLEKECVLATAGSGNRQGALYAKLPVKPTNQGELHLAGFLHSVNRLKQLDPAQTLWSQCGVAQLATNGKELKRQHDLLDSDNYPEELICVKTAEELTNIAGTRIEHSGLFFPDAGWVSPRDLCNLLIEHDNISVKQANITDIQKSGEEWILTDVNSTGHKASHVVICNAEFANQFAQTSHLPLKPIRGQVSTSRTDAFAGALDTVVCGEGYIAPAKDNQLCFGATFDLKGRERNITVEDHQKNLTNLALILPDIHEYISSAKGGMLQGRTAFRCSTPDYMPIVGPVPEFCSFIETFGKLRKDRKWLFRETSAKHHTNLYINTGHGSKGLITCPISAELIASMICAEPLPLPKNLVDIVNPARFIIKNLIKQVI